MGLHLNLAFFIILITFSVTNAQEGADAAFENYLSNLMKNYSSWLSDRDPFGIPDTITLNGVNVLDRVNVTLEIEGQYMDGQSKVPADTNPSETVNLDLKTFSIVRNNLGGNGIIGFGGRYKIISGVYRNDALEEKHFSGDGIWLLKTNETTESLTIGGFVLNDDGYIDIAPANKAWNFITDWRMHDYEGLIMDDYQDHFLVVQAIGIVYKDYLRSRTRDAIPPFQLLLNYMQETVAKTKLSDIIRDWEPTTPPTTTPESSAGIVMPFGLFIIAVASLLTNILAI